MSNVIAPRCCTCGAVIGDKYELFCYLRQLLIEKYGPGTSMNPAFEAINIREKKVCCKRIMLMITPADLARNDRQTVVRGQTLSHA